LAQPPTHSEHKDDQDASQKTTTKKYVEFYQPIA